MSEQIILRQANRQDTRLLEYWDKQPHVIAAAPNDIETDWRDQEELANTYIAQRGDERIGVIWTYDAKYESEGWSRYSGEVKFIHLWIGGVANMGKGFGRIMLDMGCEKCFDDPDVKYVCGNPLVANKIMSRWADPKFYIGQEYFEDDLCALYCIAREEFE